ncbi:MAG: hypothetical protein A2677_03985 [Candidatus Komeilibacteria bacterium RIFCSPHIGHO2_01_FULL_52_14]|uniref:GIY-YIG domain-containing protein n=1 Tax=Candidatus Komeilibacteria bacterium RIFCSPHIGHO2_01_FULL_52_14 TaxID=1798549 RepID=A0A1G2BKG6_9BACT|nr:MAG: hypothetical protein A2677_03985 [Candidatus Komeilibacteria bacterium RIFCSPHIGHO2_01_FULL_52_14]
MKGYVYILQDQKGRLYVGSTEDIKRRLRQHRLGHTQTTRNMTLPKVALIQEYDTLEAARLVERRLKRLKRKDYVLKMIADGHINIEPS